MASLKQGPQRHFRSTVLDPAHVLRARITNHDLLILTLVTVIASVVRFWRLDQPDGVVFDETHFGGFAREYLFNRFHVDVHPPLTKMIYYWIARAAGYDGGFTFAAIGDSYPDNVYVWMRAFSAGCGVATVMLTYLTLRTSGCHFVSAFLGSLVVTFENSLATQSRFILLDAPLLLGISLAIYGVKRTQIEVPMSGRWLKSLILTGLGTWIAISTKLTGIFTLVWVILVSSWQLWRYYGDLELRTSDLLQRTAVKVSTVLFLPLTLYLATYAIHFAILDQPGYGLGRLPAEFQATLDPEVLEVKSQVSYGSTVSLKHHQIGGYLHSHDAVYENSGSSELQQVTLYDFANDLNNEWIIEGVHHTPQGKLQQSVKSIQDGNLVRLYHKGTQKYLHVSDVKPPTSENDYSREVNCNATRGLLGDSAYEFRVRIVQTRTGNSKARYQLKAGETVFQLVHNKHSCVLMGHSQHLPRWGNYQKGVICITEPTTPGTLWYVEDNFHPMISGNASYDAVKLPPLGFLGKVKMLHELMFSINSGFVENHPNSVTPDKWPWGVSGTSMYLQRNSQVYFLPNIVVYLCVVFLVTLTIAKGMFYVLAHLNPFKTPSFELFVRLFNETALELVLGWVIHYWPHFSMPRELFVHHYLPALYFGMLLMGEYADYHLRQRPIIGTVLVVVAMGGIGYTFYDHHQLIYGTFWAGDQCQSSRWLQTWRWACSNYVEEL